MPGFYTGNPTESVQVQNLGADILPTTTGEAANAAVSSGFHDWYETRGVHAVPRWVDGMEPDILQPKDANAQYGIEGSLSFDKPISREAAQDLHSEKHAEIVRQDTINSAPTTGLPTAAGLLTAFADPIGVAASFIPGVGEERAVATLARFGIQSRRAARGLEGATQYMAGSAALEPLNYGLDQQEHNDWSMSQALTNLAFGGIFGGGLHMVLPSRALKNPEEELFRAPTEEQMANPNSGFMESQSPEIRDAALKEAVGAQLEGRPNVVSELIEAHNFAEPTAATGGVSLRDIAASLDPETFEAFDKLSGQASETREAIQNASDQAFDPTHDEDILADRAAHHEVETQIQSLTKQAGSLKGKRLNKIQSQIDDLRSGIEDLKARSERQTSAEMAHDRDATVSELRQKLQKLDYQMRDMAPALHAAHQISDVRFRRLARRYARRNGLFDDGSVSGILSAAQESQSRLKSAARVGTLEKPRQIAEAQSATESSIENAPKAASKDAVGDAAEISADAERMEAEFRALYGEEESASHTEPTFDEDENAADAYQAAAACLVRGL